MKTLLLLAALDLHAVARLLNLPAGEAPAAERRPAPARLSGRLHGTLVAQDARYSVALVESRSLFVGEQYEGLTVRSISRGCVVLDDQELCVVPRAGAPSPSPGLHVALTDFAQWTQIRIVPVPNGFKLFGIAPGSIYEKLGVQNGDILRKVNGKPADFSVLPLVHPGAHLTVELERNGQRFDLEGQLD